MTAASIRLKEHIPGNVFGDVVGIVEVGGGVKGWGGPGVRNDIK